MSTHQLPGIASLRRQQLLIEFGSLQAAPPDGVYMSLTPGDRSLWTGVIFVRKGAYSPAILRFQVRFPPTYPDLPPLVTFSTDIFHPLLVPLTTYTFTTGSSDTDTVSATDEERLPPGGFSLRHGFPHWFGRARRSVPSSGASSRNVSGSKKAEDLYERRTSASEIGPEELLGSSEGQNWSSSQHVGKSPFHQRIPISKILQYIRSTFDDESVLDSVPLEAAGNPGAWHAWRAHRRATNRLVDAPGKTADTSGADLVGTPQKKSGPGNLSTPAVVKQPGDWNWEGVWAKRVRIGIDSSLSEPVLFGGNIRGGDDALIRFSQIDDEVLEEVKETILVGNARA